ncbi:MAG: amidohydrolase family protein, partial [Akkermansia sp.]
KEGVTTWLPTTLTLAPKTLEDIQKTVAEYMKTQEYAKTPGVHLEGPYINARCCGAQNPAFVRTADIDEVKRLNDIARVLLISLAPETEGAIDFIAEASQMGIRCSAGHSAATHADFIKAKTAGLVHLTHFCNQMSPIHHREIGLVGSGLLDHEIKIEVICDQIHLCGDMLKTIFTTKCIGQMMMITDSLACSWMPDGPGDLGGLPIIVKGGVARLAESGNLAGSTLKYAYGLRNIHQLTGLPLSQLVKATSWNQAQSLGLTGLGKIAPGFIADMVLLNDDYSTSKVIIDGVEKYTA